MFEHQVFYSNQDEFLEKIDDVSRKSEWENIPLSSMPEKVEGSTEGVLFHHGATPVFLRECALRSLRQRLKSETDLVTQVCNGAIHGTPTAADDSLRLENYIKWATEVLKARGEGDSTVKVGISEGGVNAFLSEEYVEYLDSSFVHNHAFETLMQSTGETDFVFNGWWDHAASIAEYQTKNE